MNRSVLSRGVLAGAALVALTVAGCASGGDEPTPGDSGAPTNEYADLSGSLDASGASFPNAYYQAALDAFSDVAPNLEIQYRSTGSGTGKKEFGEGLTDFAGSDSLVKEGDGPALDSFYYIPTVAAPITVSYNLPEVAELQLSGSTVGSIFARKITKWNDPAIAEDNPGVDLPDKDIVVVHRSDGSGTTNNFTGYLAKAGGPDWTLGRGDSVAWAPDTQGGDKNTGVAAVIQQTDASIGYVDLADATASGLVFAAIKNKDGNYVPPTLDGTTAGLGGAEVSADLTYDPLDAAGADAYPITAPTYILVKKEYDAEKGPLVIGFLKWLLTDGRQYAEGVHFAVLPDALQQQALAQLDKVVING